jgi:dimeric dUTPase (all-alpha-NTP-PPase superfamily)
MIQNFSNIIAEQRKLDNEIMNKFEKNYEITFKERKLALLVELSELANEIRSFKY